MLGLIFGLMLPLLGTMVGSAGVYVFKNKFSSSVNNLVMGFAAGVMLVAAFLALFLPSMEMTEGEGIMKVLPAVGGFIAGVVFLLLLDNHEDGREESSLNGGWKLMLAIILHNIPEGMAIGVAFAAAMVGNAYLSVAAALTMSIGIAIHNIPTGAIVSLLLRSGGMKRNRSFLMGVVTGVVQPLAALATIWLASFIMPFMVYLLAFAAGAMIYVVVEELIPGSSKGVNHKLGPIGFSIGFILMIILDAVLHEA